MSSSLHDAWRFACKKRMRAPYKAALYMAYATSNVAGHGTVPRRKGQKMLSWSWNAVAVTDAASLHHAMLH